MGEERFEPWYAAAQDAAAAQESLRDFPLHWFFQRNKFERESRCAHGNFERIESTA